MGIQLPSNTPKKQTKTNEKPATEAVAKPTAQKDKVRPTSASFIDTSSEPEIRLTARVPMSFKTKVKVMCAQNNITVSAYITNLIEADLKKNGMM